VSTAYKNGKIYTVNPDQPWAEALVVEDGVIVAIGTEEDIRPRITEDTEVVDLEGRMMMPGIHDAHLHLLFSGLKFRFEPRLSPGGDQQRVIEDIRSCNCSGPVEADGTSWVLGGDFFPPDLGPDGVTKDFLDEAFPDQPVFLYDYTIHHGLANSKALELAGISEDITDPPGGRYIRDEATGALTGEMVEQARWPVLRSIPDYSRTTNAEAIAWAVSVCHEFGITSVQEASASPQALRAFRDLDQENQLKIRIAAHLVWRDEGFGMATLDDLESTIKSRDEWASKHVDTRFIKVWLDGAPLPPNFTQADLAEDGTVDETNILVPEEEFVTRLAEFDAAGLTVKIHCAGEGSTRRALDAIEKVRTVNGPGGPRHEVAHAGFISPSDYGRLQEHNVVAEMSPAIWHVPEYGLTDYYHFNSVLKNDAHMTVGSDWIITSDPNLFPALQGMLQHASESIDLPAALEAMTISGARAVNQQKHQGSLEVGKTADFIVLDRNLFDVPVDEIGATQVLRTVFEGETVFHRQ
jgi:predicted amidohydrolase YtcJ